MTVPTMPGANMPHCQPYICGGGDGEEQGGVARELVCIATEGRRDGGSSLLLCLSLPTPAPTSECSPTRLPHCCANQARCTGMLSRLPHTPPHTALPPWPPCPPGWGPGSRPCCAQCSTCLRAEEGRTSEQNRSRRWLPMLGATLGMPAGQERATQPRMLQEGGCRQAQHSGRPDWKAPHSCALDAAAHWMQLRIGIAAELRAVSLSCRAPSSPAHPSTCRAPWPQTRR